MVAHVRGVVPLSTAGFGSIVPSMLAEARSELIYVSRAPPTPKAAAGTLLAFVRISVSHA